ncbi:MAG TPA: cytochrome c oxidase subunit II [Anaerolineales bacterium]|nr:cytochrome c oxidase subunit II [Anaerolineales bacterium]
MRHFVVVGIFVIVVSILTYVGLDAAELMPEQASAQAVSIDWLWDLQLVAMSFLFALIVVPMAYSFIVFRRRKGETGDGEHIEGNTGLEITWTVIPLVAVLGLAYLGAYSLGDISRVDPNAMVVNVRGQQFAWIFEYPEYGIVSDELHLPVNRQVVLKMESPDVIHSFWVPEFRVKQDVVPGRVTEYRITPTVIGAYKVRCAELCGSNHYSMINDVIVQSQADYDAWIAVQSELAAASQTPEGIGQRLTVQYGCTGCHSLDGSSRPTGPTWLGLFDSQRQLADGTVVTADEEYIIESILEPNAKIAAGFQSPSLMPAIPLTNEEIEYIIAYIQTLR